VAKAVKGLNMMLQHQGGVGSASPQKGATVEGVDDRPDECICCKARGSNSFQDLG